MKRMLAQAKVANQKIEVRLGMNRWVRYHTLRFGKVRRARLHYEKSRDRKLSELLRVW